MLIKRRESGNRDKKSFSIKKNYIQNLEILHLKLAALELFENLVDVSLKAANGHSDFY